VPKAIALRDPERLAAAVARPILGLSRVSAGLVRLLTASTNLVLGVLGLRRPQESPFVSEEEVRYLVREGAAKGIFEKAEEELVQNVFEFGDTTVREIMIPLPRIAGLDVATPPEEIARLLAALGHSRVPVYQGDIIHPRGPAPLTRQPDGTLVVDGLAAVRRDPGGGRPRGRLAGIHHRGRLRHGRAGLHPGAGRLGDARRLPVDRRRDRRGPHPEDQDRAS
jgi:hypothetical protein